MYFDPNDEYSLEDLKVIFIEGNLGQLCHSQMVATLREKEDELIDKATAELVALNASEHGGSSHGFFYNGELFCTQGGFGKHGISDIHPDLEERAQFLKMDRIEVPQYTTYIAHFFGWMDNNVTSVLEYIANVPGGLIQFSSSLKLLKSTAEQRNREALEALKFDREDKDKATYFHHYDRINTAINRFLFRRITR